MNNILGGICVRLLEADKKSYGYHDAEVYVCVEAQLHYHGRMDGGYIGYVRPHQSKHNITEAITQAQKLSKVRSNIEGHRHMPSNIN
jgi:hypothetical protein